MIQLSPRAAERFRAAARRCVVGRPRGFAPAIVLSQTPKLLTLSAVLGEVVLWLRVPIVAADDKRGVISFATLDTIARADGDTVSIEIDKGEVHLAWKKGSEDRRASGEVGADPGEAASLPAVRMRSMGPEFRVALHECGKTASRDSGRFALSKILLRGKEGSIVGSDGRNLLVWSGFDLPFQDDLLVSAIPFFGSSDLAEASAVRIGRSTGRFLVNVDDWTVGLAIDETGRYAKIESVIPKQPGAARLLLADLDVQRIVELFEDRPVTADEQSAIIVDLGRHSAIIVPGEDRAAAVCCDLNRSTFAGTAARTAIDRRHLFAGAYPRSERGARGSDREHAVVSR